MSQSRVDTGIPGLNKHLQGGFIESSVNLVTGGPGTGKTIFCLQYIMSGIKNNESSLYITFDENVQSLVDDAKVFGWDLYDDKIKLLTFEPFSHLSIREHLINLIKKNKIKRVVVDSISVLSMAAGQDLYYLRKELYNLVKLFKDHNVTCLVTAESNPESNLDSSRLTRDGIIEYVAESVISLHNSGLGGDDDRSLRVIKMRRTNHSREPLNLKISSKGLKILKNSL